MFSGDSPCPALWHILPAERGCHLLSQHLTPQGIQEQVHIHHGFIAVEALQAPLDRSEYLGHPSKRVMTDYSWYPTFIYIYILLIYSFIYSCIIYIYIHICVCMYINLYYIYAHMEYPQLHMAYLGLLNHWLYNFDAHPGRGSTLKIAVKHRRGSPPCSLPLVADAWPKSIKNKWTGIIIPLIKWSKTMVLLYTIDHK